MKVGKTIICDICGARTTDDKTENWKMRPNGSFCPKCWGRYTQTVFNLISKANKNEHK